MSKIFDTMADQDFSRAQNRALLSRIAHIFDPGGEDLLPFEEAKRILKPGSESYSGLAAVPLDRIVGSEGRYRDFNRRFLPRKSYLRQRWTSIDKTRYEDIVLPPVRLYEMGGVYFVRDGNHRVSVARSMGQLEIDAEVTSLQVPLELRPDMDIDELKAAVIEGEKRSFCDSTGYLSVIGEDDLNFSEPGRYDTIKEHVDVHKYYLNEKQASEIPWPSALWSWHENVFGPIVLAIREERLLADFPGRTEADLYLFLVRHWGELKTSKKRDVGVGDAARDFKALQGKNNRRVRPLARFLEPLASRLRAALSKPSGNFDKKS